VAQVTQLGATLALLRAATAPHRPLPDPWFRIRLDSWGVMLGGAAAVAAVGGGVLVVSVLSQVQADGVGEWRQMLAEEDATSAALLAVGAVLLAPATEELYFRGYLLPSLTKWMSPAAAVSGVGHAGLCAALLSGARRALSIDAFDRLTVRPPNPPSRRTRENRHHATADTTQHRSRPRPCSSQQPTRPPRSSRSCCWGPCWAPRLWRPGATWRRPCWRTPPTTGWWWRRRCCWAGPRLATRCRAWLRQRGSSCTSHGCKIANMLHSALL